MSEVDDTGSKEDTFITGKNEDAKVEEHIPPTETDEEVRAREEENER